MSLTEEINYASLPLPTPTGNTPYRTPVRQPSQRSSRRVSLSPGPSSSPPKFAIQNGYFISEQDVSKNERISAMEPRLHANLVAEILQLRRELEKKDGYVLHLEEQLHTTKEDQAKLTSVVEEKARETKSQSRHLLNLEETTVAALGEMAQERDTAVETLTEVRRRLDVSQKKVRSQEQDMTNIHEMHQREKQAWASERQKLERKVHVTEERLKTVLKEVAASQVDMPQPSGPTHFRKGSMDATDLEAIDENTVGVFERSDSRTSNASSRDGRKSRNTRNSTASLVNGGIGKRIETTLADELLDEYENDEVFDDDDEEDDHRTSLTMQRPFSAQSHIQSSKARRVLGLTVESQDTAVEEKQLPKEHASRRPAESELEKPLPILPKDTDGIARFSPPGSPSVGSPSTAQTQEKDVWGSNEPKRFSLDPATPLSLLESQPPKPSTMVSTSSQTLEQPISPPDTPVTKEKDVFAIDPPVKRAEMITTSTQTIEAELSFISNAATRADDALAGLDVPIIAIHPPNAGIISDRTSVVLPPQTKSAGVQAAMKPQPERSVSVQTEEIRIDQRPVKLPPHLLPSSISSNPPSPVSDTKSPTSTIEPPRRKAPLPPLREPPPVDPNFKRRNFLPDPASNGYVNDDGPLNQALNVHLKRPVRDGSLFAGFDDSNVEADREYLTEADWSDDVKVIRRLIKGPVKKSLGKVNGQWGLIPSTKDAVLDSLESHRAALEESQARALRRDWDDGPEPAPRPKQAAATQRSDLRKASLISNEATKDSQRLRSPSEPTLSIGGSVTSAPPFPVPTRFSSRKLTQTASDGANSPTPQSRSFFSIPRSKEDGRPHIKKPMLRKARSAAATREHPREIGAWGEESPQSPLSMLSNEESLPPPIPKRSHNRVNGNSSRPALHRNAQPAAVQASLPEQVEAEGVSAPAVVDALASAMVGNWMWKYMRKRTSLGKEVRSSALDSPMDHGPRHKRWVWVVPFEKAILWSAKQPTSGSTLLGKNARKRELYLFTN